MATYHNLQAEQGAWLRTALIMGIIAGIIFSLFEMAAAWFIQGNPFMPLRMIGAMALGDIALAPGYPLLPAAIVGMAIHLVLSALYGVVFGAIVLWVPMLGINTSALVTSSAAYGLILWLVNFYAIAAIAFPWFLQTNPIVQFLAHTLFYGAALGLLLASSTFRSVHTTRASEQHARPGEHAHEHR